MEYEAEKTTREGSRTTASREGARTDYENAPLIVSSKTAS